jgi:histidinol-phosphate/aromatic aminotransferase/cobyric acid decarboxylase-like protein
VTPTPTYGRFVNAIEAHGAALVRVPVNDKLEQDLNAMTAAIR